MASIFKHWGSCTKAHTKLTPAPLFILPSPATPLSPLSLFFFFRDRSYVVLFLAPILPAHVCRWNTYRAPRARFVMHHGGTLIKVPVFDIK